MLKIMPQTPSNLEVHTVLINHITVKDLMKLAAVRTSPGCQLKWPAA